MGGLPANRTVNGFAVNPSNSKVMYVALRDGLFKTTDGGEKWLPIGKGPTKLAAVVVNPRKDNEIFVATTHGLVFKSLDHGMNWQRIN